MSGTSRRPEFFSPVVKHYRNPGIALTLLRQSERRELPSHGHENAYFSFLMSGSYRERIGARELDQRPPAVVFHPPGLEHMDAYGTRGGQILAVELEPSWLDTWPEPRIERSAPRELQGESILRAVWSLYRALASPESPLPLQIEARTAELVDAVFHPESVPERRSPVWLSRIVDRLRAEYVTPPSISSLAHEANVHPAHLSRTFRRYQGCSPTAFVQRLRVRHVWMRLTEDEPPPLAHVALEAGFSDQSHCTRVFGHFVGSPPGRFRRDVLTLEA